MASALFKLSSDNGSNYLAAGTAMADANALAYVAAGSYSMKAALDSTSGVGAVAWAITSADDAHAASLPTVTTAADKTCTFTVPKTGGAWLLRCTVNGGVNAQGNADASLVRSLAIKVLSEGGHQVVAVGEVDEAGTYGWTKAVNDAIRAVGGNSGNSVVYQPSGAAGNGVYTTWATAVAAAQELEGIVTIAVDASLGTPTFSGTVNLERRIRVVAFGSSLPVSATVSSGAVMQNAAYFEGITFAGNLSASLLTTTDGQPHNLTFNNCTRAETADSADLITLATGTNKIGLLGSTTFTSASRAAITLASGKDVSLQVNNIASVDAGVVSGSAGTLTATVDPAATLAAQSGFTSTLTRTSTVASYGPFYGMGQAGAGGAGSPLTEPGEYTNWTLAPAASIRMGGMAVNVSGTLALGANAILHNDGNNGTADSATAGTGGSAIQGQLAGAAVNGASGGGAGSPGGSASAASNALGGAGGGGGKGNGGATAGGSGGAATAAIRSSVGRFCIDLCMYILTGFTRPQAGAGGGGGGGGAANPGGGGGSGGGIVWIAAKTITMAAGSRISANGGNGSNISVGNGGGGGGGGGGCVFVFCDTLTTTGAYSTHFQANGGTGGTSAAGVAGTNGSAGHVYVFERGTLVYST